MSHLEEHRLPVATLGTARVLGARERGVRGQVLHDLRGSHALLQLIAVYPERGCSLLGGQDRVRRRREYKRDLHTMDKGW